MLKSVRVCAALVALSVGFIQAAAAVNRNPAQFEKEIRAFEASDRTNPPPKGAVLFVGSSSIRLWTNLAESFPKLQTVRRGFGGSHINDSIAFAERIILPYEPSKIVMYAGENDIARGDSPTEVFADFKTFVAKIEKALPKTEIYYISIKPSQSRWHLSPQQIEANRLIRKYCARDKKLTFIDIWPALLTREGQPDPTLYKTDKLHLNQKGYAIWKRIISEALESREKRSK